MNDIRRFDARHRAWFPQALEEIRAGKKESHWMWYIFPQLRGLGVSHNAWFYGLEDLAEAEAFAQDAFLGGNLRAITEALLLQPQENAAVIFGFPDTDKLRSCMTLFALADPDCDLYRRVLERFFHGLQDTRTLQMLGCSPDFP